MSGLMYGAGSSGSGSGGGGTGDREKANSFNLDSTAEQSFVTFFKNIPEKSDGTVRLFDRQEFYSAHGEDALLVATTVFKTLSVVKYLGAGGSKNGLPSVTLSISAAKAFLREALTSKQMRVEIWKGGGKRSSAWQLDVHVSRLLARRESTQQHARSLSSPFSTRRLRATSKGSKISSSCTQT